MANYRNPIDLPNPFYTTPLVVMSLRLVRIQPSTGEVVQENPNTLVRYIRRVDSFHTHPRRRMELPIERNIPNSTAKKVDYY